MRRLVEYFPTELGHTDDISEDLLHGYMRNTSEALAAMEVRNVRLMSAT